MLPNSQPRPQRSSPAETGKKVKNYIYQYSDLIGRGNFARVYKGLNLNNHQTLAIKLISLDELKCKHLESLVFEEIKILQLMRHPNILKFHEALLSQRNCYIVTQLCGQGSLEDRMRSQQPLTEQQLGDIIVDLYNGLRYLREKGVTHRDVKPANIFIHNGQRKLADFGLAKFYKQRFHDLDIGSPHYMSPEGLILNNYGEKTDLWSLGITIYELIHGVTPFVECRSAQELRVSITRPIPEHKWRGDIHPLLRQMINRLLEVDEMKRLSVYQLENQPYISMVLQRRKQDKLREGISPERIRVCLPGCGGVGWRPASFTTGVSQDAAKVANQQMYSTNSSEKSTHSAKEPLQQSVNHSMRSLSQNLQQNGELQLSFSKMNNTSNQIIGHGPINEISFNLSPLQGRSSDYNSEQIKHSEGRQTYLYRNPSQQIVPLQNQCLFGPLQRQKTASFQTATTDNQKKQYSSALTVRPKHYFC